MGSLVFQESETSRSPGPGRTALLVSSNEGLRETRASCLRGLRLQVDEVDNVSLARSLWQPDRYWLVAVDVRSELEARFCAEIKKLNPEQRLVVLAEPSQVVPPCADEVVLNDFGPGKLSRVVEQWMTSGSASTPSNGASGGRHSTVSAATQPGTRASSASASVSSGRTPLFSPDFVLTAGCVFLIAAALAVYVLAVKFKVFERGRPAAPVSGGNPSAMVWASTETGLYFCSGTSGYRKGRGKIMTQQKAQQAAFQPAKNTPCQ
ncbi:MAG: hypothetical protein ACE14M_00810 [Terriglobales bacterium]